MITKWIAVVVLALAIGWGLGVATSVRINSGAAAAYAWELDQKTQIACRNALGDQHAQDEKEMQGERMIYSERITGLEAQLRAHGIKEAIIAVGSSR